MSAAEEREAGAEGVPESGSLGEGIRMVVTVTLVTAISAGLLGYVYSQTKAPIDAAKAAELESALRVVLPPFDTQEWRCLEPAGAPTPDTCTRGMHVAQKGTETVGSALRTSTTQGFGPRIELLVGADADGAVTGVYVLGHQETPGLGALVTDGQTEWAAWREECRDGCTGGRPFLKQLANRRADTFAFHVKKDGGDVDAITASTITSRAVVEEVGAALALMAAERGRPAGEVTP